MDLSGVGRALGWLVAAGYAALMVVELPRYFKSALSVPGAGSAGALEARAESPVSWRGLLAWVLGAFVASRLVVLAVLAVACRLETGSLESFWSLLRQRMQPWDARHYLNIIENGYLTEGEPRLLIVFFPLYPMLCRIFTFLTALPAFEVAVAVSGAAMIGCGAVLFRMAEAEGGAALARRATLLLMFNPMTYYYAVPYSESVFLLMTLLAVFFARRRRWPLAVLFGALASNARVLGVAVAIPIFWEMLAEQRDRAVERGEARVPARRVALCVVRVLPVCAGLLLYLELNARLFGNPTQFLIFQRENWYQSFAGVANTFRYSLVNAFTYDVFLYRFGVWWPQTLLLIGVPLLLLLRRRRERPGDAAYLLVYQYVSFAPSWLLSGPRYLSACYAVYPLLARIPKSKKGFVALMAAQCALMAAMTVIGMWFKRAY